LSHGVQDLDATVRLDGDGGVGIGYGGEGGVNGSAADLDGDEGIQTTDGGFEGSELEVFIRKDTKAGGVDVDTEGDTSLDGLFLGLEPGLALGLFEDVMEDSIVCVVV
jgi:hypothetical protein